MHPDVAIHLAQWASPRFGVAVSKLVRRYQTGKVTTGESIAASRQLADQVKFVDDDTKKIQNLELRERRLAIQREEYNFIQDIAGAVGDDPRVKQWFKDFQIDIVRSVVGKNNADGLDEEPGYRTIEDHLKRTFDVVLTAPKERMALGKLCAVAYRERNSGRIPEKVDKFVNGEVRKINAYERTSWPMISEIYTLWNANGRR